MQIAKSPKHSLSVSALISRAGQGEKKEKKKRGSTFSSWLQIIQSVRQSGQRKRRLARSKPELCLYVCHLVCRSGLSAQSIHWLVKLHFRLSCLHAPRSRSRSHSTVRVNHSLLFTISIHSPPSSRFNTHRTQISRVNRILLLRIISIS